MKAWIVHWGRVYLGRILARSVQDAVKEAEAHWGRGKLFTIKQVEKKR